MESGHTLYILFIHVFYLHKQLVADCPASWEACQYENTHALSTKMHAVKRRDIFPLSCASFCTRTENCIGVNEINDTGMCQVLEEDDIIPGLEWYDLQNCTFWSFEKPCPKVQ